MSIKDQILRSPVSRVSVDGGKIKFIRESKGLTQLYVATFLSVTTDTVSRWENGRYPTVKWENVEKLAEALDVTPEELLDSGAGQPGGNRISGGSSAEDRRWRKRLFPIVLVIILAIVAGGMLILSSRQKVFTVTATRFLPKHIAPGQPFPVVVRVESSGAQPFAFIMEEKLPINFTVLRGQPEVAAFDSGTNTVKWIGNSRLSSPFFLAYLVVTSADLQKSVDITFTGRIKADNASGLEQHIQGNSELTISNHHWVDANVDGIINDEEILTAFSSAELLRDLGVDMDLIRQIWSAGSYSWDQKTNQYQIGK